MDLGMQDQLHQERRQDQSLRSCMHFMNRRSASCHHQAICCEDKWVIFIAHPPWMLCHQAELPR